jgi:(p)ppGpp synthase/HD superfamily hydrolase
MPEPMTKLADAFAYTARIHATQVRKGTTIPYLSHLMSVSALVLEHGGDEELAIAGLLHDAIEDVGAEQEPIILERYGARVAHIVRACTDAYLAHLETADPDVLLVSCADKLHNARAILSDLRTDGPAVFNRFTAGQDGTLWYYKALAEVFLQRLANSIAQRLRETVSALVAETIAAAVTQ